MSQAFLSRKRQSIWWAHRHALEVLRDRIEQSQCGFLESCVQYLATNKVELPQDLFEFAELIIQVRHKKPRVVMEIGSREGGSLYCLGLAAPIDATVISVDLPGGQWGWRGSGRKRSGIAAELERQGRHVSLIDGDSHLQATMNQVITASRGIPIDMLFIDGDHSDHGVRQDWELYRPLVRPGGMIALHDIARNPLQPAVEVWRLWAEIRRQYRTKEVVQKFGIGLVYM